MVQITRLSARMRPSGDAPKGDSEKRTTLKGDRTFINFLNIFNNSRMQQSIRNSCTKRLLLSSTRILQSGRFGEPTLLYPTLREALLLSQTLCAIRKLVMGKGTQSL